jgi:hypothetical protein
MIDTNGKIGCEYSDNKRTHIRIFTGDNNDVLSIEDAKILSEMLRCMIRQHK